MSVFSMANEGGVGESAPESAEFQGSEQVSGTEEESTQDAAQETTQEGSEERLSRRERARRETEARISAAIDPFKKQNEELSRRIQQAEAQLQRTLGALEAMQRQPAPQAAPQGPQGPDPEELYRRADEALQAGNYAEHKRLERQAMAIEYDRRLERATRELEEKVRKQIPTPIHPVVQAMLAQHPAVANAGERGAQLVQIKKQELMLYGHPDTPETLKKAFEMSEQVLGGRSQQPAAQSFDRGSAAALTAAPTNRGAGGGARETPKLTEVQQRVARAMGWTDAQYLAELNKKRSLF